MKSLLKIAAALLLGTVSLVSQAQTKPVPTYSDPYKMMEILADQTFQRIAKEQAEHGKAQVDAKRGGQQHPHGCANSHQGRDRQLRTAAIHQQGHPS